MWPANSPGLNPVDYHILWCYLSEIQRATQQAVLKAIHFWGKQYNLDQVNEFYISQGNT